MLTLLALVLIGILAVAILIASAYFFLRARRREDAAPDPSDSIVEMRALGQRIETLVGQQQLQGETARQQLAQKMDAVGQTVDQQRHHLSGLQNELRHEVRRRDAEMEDIRTQLASIQHSARLDGPPALALPEVAAPAAEVRDTPEVPAALDTPVFETPTFEVPVSEMPAFETPVFEAPVFEAPAFEAPAFEAPTLPPFQTGDGVAFTDDGWDVGQAPTAPPVFSDPFAETPPPSAPPVLPVFESVSPFAEPDPFGGPEAAPDSDFEPFDFVPPADPEPAATGAMFAAPSSVTFEEITPSFLPGPSSQPAPSVAPPSQTAWVSLAGRSVAPAVPTFQPPVFEPVAMEASAFEPAQAPAFATPAFETPAFQTPAFQAAEFQAPAASAPVVEAPLVEEAAPAVPPPGADRLTRIASITEEMETALYASGVTTLDEIARWGRSDARRIASAVAVSEDTIMNKWIFEAQAALFQSFATAQQGR